MHYPTRSACYPEVVAEVTPLRSPRPEGPDPTDPPPDATENRLTIRVRTLVTTTLSLSLSLSALPRCRDYDLITVDRAVDRASIRGQDDSQENRGTIKIAG